MSTPAATSSLAVTFVGHSTVLLEMDGARVLTDPLLRQRVGVLIRHSPLPARDISSGLDAVLVSHAHLDHLDVPSLRLVEKTTAVVVPRGVGRLVRRLGFADVVEMEAGDERRVGRLLVTAVPAFHSGARHPMAAESAALGYLVAGGLRAYFAGDTGVYEGMRELAPGLDLALLPVGGWGPRLPEDHLNPLTAAKALRLLRPAVAVPIHWGTLYPPWLPPAFNAKFGRWPGSFMRYAAHLAPEVDVRVLESGQTTRITARGRPQADREP